MDNGKVFSCLLLLTFLAVSCDAYKKHFIDWNDDIRECYGTFNGITTSGDAAFRYMELRQRYTGCNRVLGNLEIVFLNDPNANYDLSFLQGIREIIGNVVIVGNLVDKISLPNLEAIRGFPLFTPEPPQNVYALFVGLNYLKSSPTRGLKELTFPKLREITRGAVSIEKNADLCFVHTINWNNLERALPEQDTINDNQVACPECDASCFNSTTERSQCWGPGPELCQKFEPSREKPSDMIPQMCKSKVRKVCKRVVTELTRTVNTLSRNLKVISKQSRKLQRALKGKANVRTTGDGA